MKNSIFLLLVSASVLTFDAQSQKVEKIWGIVTDYDNQKSVVDVKIQIIGLPQMTKTDDNGNFSIFIENPITQNLTVRFQREGFESQDIQISLPLKTPLDIRLKKVDKPTILITRVVVGNSITGQVNNITGTMEGKYKVLVYFFTDKYYIHPWKDSQLPINSATEWKIGSVRHPGPCPDKVLAAIVDINFVVPPIIYGVLDGFIAWNEVDATTINCK